MPRLSRTNAAPLLRVVNGKQHASDEDHEAQAERKATGNAAYLPTPASSTSTRISRVGVKEQVQMDDEDVYADPISSDEEPSKTFKLPGQSTVSGVKSEESTFRKPTSRLDATSEQRATPQFTRPGGTTPPQSAGSKRSADAASSSDSDAQIFSSQASQGKRSRKAVYPASNIHAPPKATFKAKKYGKQEDLKRARDEEREKKAVGFKSAKAQKEKKAKEALPAKFKTLDLPTTVCETPESFRQPRPGTSGGAEQDYGDVGDPIDDLSSELSDVPVDLTSEPPEELQNPEPSIRQTECAVCSTFIPATMREDFEDQHSQARQWSYKWQQRFCRWHKQQQALEQWEAREYLEIDWEALPARLRQRKMTRHIKRVISGEEVSVFRQQFEARVKSGAKTAMQAAIGVDSGKGASAGYYGPRGEKMMTDHIVTTFSTDLRTYSTKDKFVAAAGVSGGLSGFVQAVLVPELAAALIREDLDARRSDRDPVEVLIESTDVGELLHPELDERVEGVRKEKGGGGGGDDDEMEE